MQASPFHCHQINLKNTRYHQRPWSSFGLGPLIKSVAMGNQWSGPMKSKDTWFHWSTPLISCDNRSNQWTESDSGSRPLIAKQAELLLAFLVKATQISLGKNPNWDKKSIKHKALSKHAGYKTTVLLSASALHHYRVEFSWRGDRCSWRGDWQCWWCSWWWSAPPSCGLHARSWTWPARSTHHHSASEIWGRDTAICNKPFC